MLSDIRSKYPITKNDIYLNHAATAPIAAATIERMCEVAQQMQRPLSEHFYPWLGIVEDTRRRLAELINCHPTEITFCQNTSSALSLVALAIAWQPGDKVLVPDNEFPSNVYVWQNLRKKGVEFEFFTPQHDLPIVETLKQINLARVRLISISAVSYLTGRLAELKEIADFCHANNIYICFDGIQAIGTTPIDVQAIGADFMASGSQKWLLGSVGAGFVYIKKAILENLLVPFVGWTSVKYPEDFSLKEIDLAEDATRFEPGLPDILPIAALNQSLRDLSAVGWNAIFQQIKNNSLYLAHSLQANGIKTMASVDQQAGIVSFNTPEKLDLQKFTQYCTKHKIHLTQRENYIRVSPHFYNTKEELDKFLSALELNTAAQFPQTTKKESVISAAKHVLLTGSTGILGQHLAHEIAAQGYHLMLVARDDKKLTAQAEKLIKEFNVTVLIKCVDLNNQRSIDKAVAELQKAEQKYDVLINCAGFVAVDEFVHLSDEDLHQMFNVNFFASVALIRAFIKDLRSSNAQGILNIVSPTGRIGYPLLSGYSASNAALWNLSESLSIELNDSDLTVTTYVAPAMHSRMQKRIGRVALRYFKTDGNFPFAHPKHIAQEAWQAFQAKKDLLINKDNRWRILLNALFPSMIKKRIKKIWKS